MIYHYFNCLLDDLEGHLNSHAKDGFKLEQMEVTGSLVHIVMSNDIKDYDPVVDQPKRVYKKKEQNARL